MTEQVESVQQVADEQVAAVFVGNYVKGIKDAIIASALCGENILLIGEPGTGKTEMLIDGSKRIAGENAAGFFEITPTADPNKIVDGLPNPAKLLGDPPVWEIILDNTARDPRFKIIVLDEIGRGSDPLLESLLHAIARKDVPRDQVATFMMTSNFMPKQERMAAVLDRIPFWKWIPVQQSDSTLEFVTSQLSGFDGGLHLPGELPSWDDVVEIRSARPGQKAINAVNDVIEWVRTEALNYSAINQSNGDESKSKQKKFSFAPNQRRLASWSRSLYRMGYYYSGDSDFTEVPPEATQILSIAWPASSYEEALAWQDVTESVSDASGARIKAIMQSSYKKMKEIAGDGHDTENLAKHLGEHFTASQTTLLVLSQDDERAHEAVRNLSMVYAAFIRGESPVLNLDI